MGGRYQIDVAGALFLQLKENFRKAFFGNFFSEGSGRIGACNGAVLTKDALQGTAGKKTVPDPAPLQMHGSSHACRAALATRSTLPSLQ